MPTAEYFVTDEVEYKIQHDKYKLDTPSLDTVLEMVEVEHLPIRGTDNEALLFTCPFTGNTTCEYYLVEEQPIGTEAEASEDEESTESMIKLAAAAHISTAHI